MVDRVELTDLLRGRVLRALHGGALRAGDRLPSAREVGEEIGVDYRIALDAYRGLADDGLVEMRPRGGIYVAPVRNQNRIPLPSAHWLSEILAQGVQREIPLTDLHEWVRRSVSTLRLRALAVQPTTDQVGGLCRELEDDYGLEAVGVLVDELRRADGAHPSLRGADLVVTTEGLASVMTPLAAAAGRRLIVAHVRPDLVGGEWRTLLRRPVYVVVREASFIPTIQRYFAEVPGADNLRFLIAGQDDLEAIPDDAPVYVTQSARPLLATIRMRGQIIPAARVFSPETSRAIVRFVVEANLDALATRRVW